MAIRTIRFILSVATIDESLMQLFTSDLRNVSFDRATIIASQAKWGRFDMAEHKESVLASKTVFNYYSDFPNPSLA